MGISFKSIWWATFFKSQKPEQCKRVKNQRSRFSSRWGTSGGILRGEIRGGRTLRRGVLEGEVLIKREFLWGKGLANILLLWVWPLWTYGLFSFLFLTIFENLTKISIKQQTFGKKQKIIEINKTVEVSIIIIEGSHCYLIWLPLNIKWCLMSTNK